LLDQFGRKITYLRLSLTERCTLRCVYCRADEGLCPKEDELSAEELIRIARVCTDLGIKRVRLTGGEPLLRKDILQIVEGIHAIPGITDLSLTTNAMMLAGLAKGLKKTGLERVNISLDSLKPEVFRQLTGGELSTVLAGIDAAIEAGLTPVKINVVLIRGVNDDEVDDFIALTKNRDLDVRFIEYMPIGGNTSSPRIPVDNRDIIRARPYLLPQPARQEGQPSADYSVPEHQGRVGFISAISHQFCDTCNRIRITGDGKLRLCLGHEDEVDLVPALKTNDQALADVIRQAIYRKPRGHNFSEKPVQDRNMRRIGG
jgi:cyclic pyranopterin phosphate synthase